MIGIEFHGEFVGPMFAQLLQIMACMCGGDIGMADRHEGISEGETHETAPAFEAGAIAA
ncbi:hypothetical protein LB566_00055 [Mesorhizobium sp. CA13]|uniref:hypothetical protein n=1 Tax=Mesorhizobium sp. CA13 TaxID=2876643 RepID=UPI001CC96688|nr:hypothetical protein [Mesorhizobium sp. CA13]MBZ9852174.1 hypothetical protein [Mesorhizobium sp. CA13]